MPRALVALLVLAFVPAPSLPAAAADYERRPPARAKEIEKSSRTRIPERDDRAKTAPAVSPEQVASLQDRVAALEAQLEALQEIIRIEGPDVRIEAPADLSLEAGATLKTRAGATALHEAAASLELKSPVTKLPEASLFGGRETLRVGAKVVGICPPQGGPLGGGVIQNP